MPQQQSVDSIQILKFNKVYRNKRTNQRVVAVASGLYRKKSEEVRIVAYVPNDRGNLVQPYFLYCKPWDEFFDDYEVLEDAIVLQ